MAQAPVPGSVKKKEPQRVLLVRLRDQEFRIAAGVIPIGVKARFLRETEFAVEWVLDQKRLGDVALCALWFLARLIDGEDVVWDAVLSEWDAAGFTIGDVEVIDETPEGDDPEA